MLFFILFILFLGSPERILTRMVDGPTFKEGRIELRHGDCWSTVCDDGWDVTDAEVACRSLDDDWFTSAADASCCASYGEGAENIILDNVECSGIETSLLSCDHNGLYNHNCGHGEDAGAVCE